MSCIEEEGGCEGRVNKIVVGGGDGRLGLGVNVI